MMTESRGGVFTLTFAENVMSLAEPNATTRPWPWASHQAVATTRPHSAEVATHSSTPYPPAGMM